MSAAASPRARDVAVGDALPNFALPVTSTVIVAGAIASRDFMPAHHDAEYARGQGAPDLFMNILTTNGYVARFVSDWAGPEGMIRKIAIRLGAPAVTTRGMKEDDMKTIAHLIVDALKNVNDENHLVSIKAKVKELTSAYPIYKDLIDKYSLKINK